MTRSILLTLILFRSLNVTAQQVLPATMARNMDGTIILSWSNKYNKPIQDIMIQRSYDSLKNFTTIGTVLNPMNTENGYPDNNPPYNRMYYRLLVTFEGGSYEIGPSTRPIKEEWEPEPLDVTAIPRKINNDNDNRIKTNPTPLQPISSGSKKRNEKINSDSSLLTIQPIVPKKIIETAFPSVRIFTNKQSAVVIHLSEFESKKYQIKFFDENDKPSFEIKKVTDEFLYIDKSNFVHSGWFRFEIYENGEIYEKNRVFISKDKGKNMN